MSQQQQSNQGYWPRTATMDWCEENYTTSPYIAEFFNCTSSFAVALVGLFGLYHLFTTHKRDTYRLATKTNAIAQHRFSLFWAYVMVSIVGFGSVLFHGTLTWQGQALDELPMLWATVAFLYALLSVKSRPSNTVSIGLFIATVLLTWVYFTFGFEVFCIGDILCTAVLVALTIRHCKDSRCPQKVRTLAKIATLLYVGGFFVFWIPETILCGNRLFESHPYHYFFNAHALFHVTSALGCYSWAVFVTFAQLDFATSQRWEREGSAFAGVVSSEDVEPATRCQGNALSLGVPLPVVVVVPRGASSNQ